MGRRPKTKEKTLAARPEPPLSIQLPLVVAFSRNIVFPALTNCVGTEPMTIGALVLMNKVLMALPTYIGTCSSSWTRRFVPEFLVAVLAGFDEPALEQGPHRIDARRWPKRPGAGNGPAPRLATLTGMPRTGNTTRFGVNCRNPQCGLTLSDGDRDRGRLGRRPSPSEPILAK